MGVEIGAPGQVLTVFPDRKYPGVGRGEGICEQLLKISCHILARKILYQLITRQLHNPNTFLGLRCEYLRPERRAQFTATLVVLGQPSYP